MRQNFDYSCGAACVLALKDLLAHKKIFAHSAQEELVVCKELGISESSGLEVDNLLSFIKKDSELNSSYLTSGACTYDDISVAIANIRNFRSGTGHFVLLLGTEGGKYRIWDPIDGKCHLLSKDDFEWMDHSGSLVCWSASFDCKLNQDPLVLIESKYFILHGEQDEFNPRYDTVSFLYDLYFKQKKCVSRVFEEQITVLDDQLYLNGLHVAEGDIVWLKIDPRQSESYFLSLRILALFEGRIKFYNPPSLVMRYDDKFLAQIIRPLNVVAKPNASRHIPWKFNNKEIVYKRLNGFGGRDVLFYEGGDLPDAMSNEDPYLFEESVSHPENNNKDARLLWHKGNYRGCVIRSSNGGRYCNMTQGGGHESIPIKTFFESLEPSMVQKLDHLSIKLHELGIKIAGVDVLNGMLVTEVNISNVSVFKNYIEDTGDNFILELLDHE